MKLVRKLFLSCLIFCAFIGSAAAEILIVAPYITGLVEDDQTGPYQLILQEASMRSGANYKELTYPEKRAVNMFKSKKAACMYSYSSIMKKEFGEDKIVTSFPLGVYKEYMFTKKGKPALTSATQLKGMSVSATLGTEDWHTELNNAGIKIDYIANDIQSIRMLEQERIQVFLGFIPDLTNYLHRLSYSPEHPLVEDYDQITCHASPKTKKFISQISKSLSSMKADGVTKNILGPLFIDFNEEKFHNSLSTGSEHSQH